MDAANFIGVKFSKPLTDYSGYSKAAAWCNENGAIIEEKEDCYVVAALPAPTLDAVKAQAAAKIDAETSAAILAGFDYEVDGETLHFSYDAFDQQNFADTVSVAMLAAQGGADGMPTQVTWNAYREYSAETGGELVRLTLNAQTFLALYTKGALAHKQANMEAGGAKKAKVEAAATVDEVNAIMQGTGV